MIKVFIDGSAGTTGLKLRELLRVRKDIEYLAPPEAHRKDIAYKRDCMERADVTFLCLPDEGAREAATLSENTRIIDASTAHRISDGWAYGFPELSKKHRDAIKTGKRISVPGCHACGFIALVRPLISAGILMSHSPLACFSLTGYSGGGKTMIAEYEDENRLPEYGAPRIYGLSQAHKHLSEMRHHSGIDAPPVFTPVIVDLYSGMAVTVPLNNAGRIDAVHAALADAYAGEPLLTVSPINTGLGGNGAMLSMQERSGKHGMQLFVSGNDERITLTAVYDNLLKGAAGAALQCFNLMTGNEETTGLSR